jgi:two-component system LytT family response regulator
MSIRCIIVDDEPNAVSLLEVFVTKWTKWQLVGKYYESGEALSFLEQRKVDLVFLDINLPHLSGMEMAALLPSEIAIVFTTAYSEYAVESYGFETLDYLLKPITLKRFLSSSQKIESHFKKNQHLGIAGAPEEYFFIKSGKMLRKFKTLDILFFEGCKEYARLVSTGEKILIYRRLKDIEEQLSGDFARSHHSYIVNVSQVDKIQDGQVFIKGYEIPISEKFRESFMSVIRQRIF